MSSFSDTVNPSVLAVLRLITSSTLVASSTGRSAGFSPFSLSTIRDAWVIAQGVTVLGYLLRVIAVASPAVCATF
jgi:hypothetical protein